MSQRLIVIAGAIIVIALVAFALLRSTQAPPVATMPPMASPRTSAPITTPPVLSEREPTKEEVVGVPRTKPEEVLQGYEVHSLTIIDVRDVDSYKERHIPGALHIPLSYIAGEVPYLPRDKPIVTYCT
jgi:hypothetical protein